MTVTSSPPEDAPDLLAASNWFARLRTRSVSAEALEEFREWRKLPGNREAYAEIERTWVKTAKLEGHPDVGQAVRDALARGQARKDARLKAHFPTRPIIGVALVGAVIASVLFGAPRLLGRTYVTGVGEQYIATLGDGSRVRLDTDTRLNVKLSGRQRQVRLERGQAFFDVAHDASRPFIVSAGDTQVQALGTRFDVRRELAGVKVTLVQGRVQVRDGKAGDRSEVILGPGQQVMAGSKLGAPRKVDVEAATSWTAGRILFHDVPLRAAIAEVNRYSPRKVVLASDRVAGVLVTGGFDSGDVEAFADAVSELHDLQPVSQGDTILLKDASEPFKG